MSRVDGVKRGLQIRGLAASYDGWPLFSGIDVSVQPGQCLILPEENDTVRTAFLECVAGIRSPDAGSISRGTVRGVWHADGLSESEPVEASIAAAIPTIDPRELLADIGLAHRGSHEPWAMSAGERRRIALAIGLYDTDAEVIILDEPERRLDLAGIRWVSALITSRLAGGAAALVATYDERIAALADLELRLAHD